MTTLSANHEAFPPMRVLLAALAGGVAEIAWVSLYSQVTAVSGMEVARQVGATVFPRAGNLAIAPVLGMIVHLALSLALVCAFAFPLRRLRPRMSRTAVLSSALVLLGAVWTFNFFVLLPALNPGLVTLLPYGVTLASKLPFWRRDGIDPEPCEDRRGCRRRATTCRRCAKTSSQLRVLRNGRV